MGGKTSFARALLAAGCAIALLGGAAPSGAASVSNGGFENGFSGWTRQPTSCCAGDWYTYSGTVSPVSLLPIPAPPQGSFAAVTDQFGPSVQILYQDFALEADATHTLDLIAFYANRWHTFVAPDSLSLAVANQQYRIDIVDPEAPVDSVAPEHILLTLLATKPGDPLSIPPTPLQADLSPFAGKTVRFRAAVVDTNSYFQGGLDAVSLTTRYHSAIAANPAVATIGPSVVVYDSLSATLSRRGDGTPLAGKTLVFKVGGQQVCSAVTDGNGFAACGGTGSQLSAALSGGYAVEFAGDTATHPSTGAGAVLAVNGTTLP